MPGAASSGVVVGGAPPPPAAALRLRIEFAPGLNRYLRQPNAAKLWMLLPPPLETVGDLCAFLQHAHLAGSSSIGRNKKRALMDGAEAGAGAASAGLPQELQLTIGGFLLPPEAPIAILRDNDVVRVQEPGQQPDAMEPPAPAPKRRKGCEQGETEADSGAATTIAPAAPAPAAEEEGALVGAAEGGGTMRRRKKKKRSKGTSGVQEQTQLRSQPPAPQQQPPQQPQQQPQPPATILPAGAGSATGKHVRFGEETQQEPATFSPEQAPSETPAGVAASPEQHEEREGARVDTLAYVHPSRRSTFVQGQDGSWTSQGRPPKPATIFLPRCLRVIPKTEAVAASASSSQAEEDKDAAAAAGSSESSESSESKSCDSEADEEEASVLGGSSVNKQRDPSYVGEYKRPYALVAVAGEQDAAAAAVQQQEQEQEQELAQYPPFPTGRKPWPAVGDVLCFRVLELSEKTMTPELTGYKTGRIVEVRPRDGELDVALVDEGGQETVEWEALQEVRVKEGPTREFLERPPSPPFPTVSPPASAEEEGDVLLEGASEGGIEDMGALIRQKRLSLLSAASTPAKGGANAGVEQGGGRRRRKGRRPSS